MKISEYNLLSSNSSRHCEATVNEISLKALMIYERVVSNPFFWFSLLAVQFVGAAAFTVVMLPALPVIGITLVAFSVLGLAYILKSEQNRKWIVSEFSLLKSTIFNLLPAWALDHPWYNEITPNISLGAAPLTSREHFDKIRDTHDAVLSLIEDFEYAPHMLGNPARPQDWQSAGLAFKQLPNPDLTPVKLEDVKKGVEWLHQQISQKKKVYVHCLAGVGRNATIVICYLIKHCGYTPQDAAAFVSSKRPIVVNENSTAIAAFVKDLTLK